MNAHGVGVVHGVERHGRGHLLRHGEQHVDALHARDDDRLVRLDGAAEGRLRGALRDAGRRLAGDGVRDPDR